MKDLERCFGISLAWGYQRIVSDDYIMIHTRTHDMSADIFTKGFQSKVLFRRLRQLINVYTLADLAEFDAKGNRRGVEDWNAPLLNSAGMNVENLRMCSIRNIA